MVITIVDLVFVVVVVCWTIILLRLSFLYWKWRTSPLRTMPGPPRTSFLWGEFRTILQEPFMQPYLRWMSHIHASSKYGDKSSYSSLLGRETVVLLDPDLVRKVLLEPAFRDPVRFEKRYEYIKETIGNGMLTLQGGAWHRHRRIIQPAFHTNALKEALCISVPKRVQSLIESWHRAGSKREIDLSKHLSALTLDVIGDVAFGHDFQALKIIREWASNEADDGCELGSIQDPLFRAIEDTLTPSAFTSLLIVFDLVWLQKFLSRKTSRTRRLLDQAAAVIVEEARLASNMGNNGTTSESNVRLSKSLLELLFDARDVDSNSGPKVLSDRELQDELKLFLTAGHETTSTWCHWALLALAKFPDVQQRVYEDVIQRGGGGEKNLTVFERIETVEQMTYLIAFMNEVLRMYPPVGILSRFTTQNECFNGYSIPKDTRLVIPIYLLHHHPDYWSKPWKFVPERWLDGGDGTENVTLPKKNNFCFLPFSAGPRDCIGRNFARIEALLIVANIVRNFEIQLTPDLRNTEFQFSLLITLKSKPPVKILAKPRT